MHRADALDAQPIGDVDPTSDSGTTLRPDPKMPTAPVQITPTPSQAGESLRALAQPRFRSRPRPPQHPNRIYNDNMHAIMSLFPRQRTCWFTRAFRHCY